MYQNRFAILTAFHIKSCLATVVLPKQGFDDTLEVNVIHSE